MLEQSLSLSDALLAALVALGSLSVYILQETRKDIAQLADDLKNHVQDDKHHCSPEKIQANHK